MRNHIDETIGDQEKSARLLRMQITAQLKELDTKKEDLIDLAADATHQGQGEAPQTSQVSTDP